MKLTLMNMETVTIQNFNGIEKYDINYEVY